jgi:hypothetical protein
MSLAINYHFHSQHFQIHPNNGAAASNTKRPCIWQNTQALPSRRKEACVDSGAAAPKSVREFLFLFVLTRRLAVSSLFLSKYVFAI